MNVVSYTEAAEIVGVTRQAINSLKSVNKVKANKYPFFIFDPDTGKPGIDIDSPAWKYYFTDKKPNRRPRKVLDTTNEIKQPLKSTVSITNNNEQDNNVFVGNVLKSVEKRVIELFVPSTTKLNKLKKMILDDLRGIYG